MAQRVKKQAVQERYKLSESEQALVGIVAQECNSTADVSSKLKALFGGVIEQMLEAEMEQHLGYDKHSVLGNNSGNSRNGYGNKTISSEWGQSRIVVPRDRNGTFEPIAVPKLSSRTDEIESRIISMYAKGVSTTDIAEQLQDIYGIDASHTLISRITDAILPEMVSWQSRPLESVYSVVFFDGIVFKVRDNGQIINKTVYTVLGIDLQGQKEILGLWISQTESASFWLNVCNELQNRGVKDILILCHDNLSGVSNAINAVFKHTEQQLCIIHQIRSSTKFVSHKDIKEVMQHLKNIYQASTLDLAEQALQELCTKYQKTYPSMCRSWQNNWSQLCTYFKYPQSIRKLIYTTNAVEGFHRMLRKYTKNKVLFPTDTALKKSVYLSIKEISKKWTMPLHDWCSIIQQLTIYFADRLQQ